MNLKKYYHKILPYTIRHFFTSINNLIRWMPIIWKDRDWNDYYIWEILKFKLKNQAKYISNNNRYVDAKYNAQRIMLCVKLIDKIQEDYYAMEYMDYHKSVYNWLDVEDRPNCKRLEIIEISEKYDEYINQHKATVRKILANKKHQIFELNKKNYKQHLSMNIGCYNKKRAQDLLFQILNRDIIKWWV